MTKRSKAYRAAAEKIQSGVLYTPAEAVHLAKSTSITKFDATVDVVFRLGVDPQAEDDVHGGVELGDRGGLGQVNGLGRGVEDSGLDLLSRGAVGLGALGHLLLLAVVVFGPREALPRFRMGIELREPAGRRMPQASTVMPMERAVPAMILAAASMSLALRSGILDSAISRT